MKNVLDNAIRALRDLGVVPNVGKTLQTATADYRVQIHRGVIDDVAAFTNSANPDIGPEFGQYLAQLLDDVCTVLAGTSPDEFLFARRYAGRCAEQKFPLDALLQSTTIVHQFIFPWVRDTALSVAAESVQMPRVVAAVNEFVGAYLTTINSIMTSEYVQRTRALAEVEGDRRSELFSLLLQGYDESDRYAADLLRRAGYLEQRQSFCVAAAQSVEPGEMENRARAQRMADALSESIERLPIRSLVGIRDNLVTVIMSGRRRQSGWTAPQSILADRVYPELRKIGPAALIGISSDVPSTAHIPHALSEAKLALSFASVSARVIPVSRISFREILVRVARDNVQSSLPRWVDAFVASNRKSRGALLATLQTYADTNMNVLRTAKTLSLHPNTIYARLQKIDDITGRNALDYHSLSELLLVMECT